MGAFAYDGPAHGPAAGARLGSGISARSAALSEDADATSTTSVSADNGLGSEGRLVVHV